jgi:hypothetical protein
VVKGGIRPVAHAFNKTVLHRIVMDIVNVPLEIAIVADGVFAEPSLPKCGFTVAMPGKRRPR